MAIKLDYRFEDSFVEVEKMDRSSFLSAKETLTRIGVPYIDKSGKTRPTLTQCCHVLHNKGRYFIVHYKQMLIAEGKMNKTDFNDDDRSVVHTVADLLRKWNLVIIKRDPHENREVMRDKNKFLVVTHKDRSDWTLISKWGIVVQNKTTGERR